MLGLDFHVIFIFCLHCALYKIHAWKLFVYGKIFALEKSKAEESPWKKKKKQAQTEKESNNNNTTTTLFFHPKIYKKEKFIIIVQTMIGALAAQNNLRVKNARQPVERKDV